jgi:hypothetical protein
LLVSIAATSVAAAALGISYLLYRSQSDPDVIVYAQTDEGRPTIINIVIENKGSASAEDVSFEWAGRLPARAWGMTPGAQDSSEAMSEGPLVHGIPALPPGEKRVITWGQYWGLFTALGGGTKEIVIRFRSRRRLFGGRRGHQTSCSLDICSFEATDASERNWDKKIAENLDRLRSSIESESQSWMRRLEAAHEEGSTEQDAERPQDAVDGGIDE